MIFDTHLFFTTGAILFAKWINHKDEIDEEMILSELDNIACKVKKHLQETRDIQTYVANTEEFPSRNNTCFEILNAIRHVMFTDMAFSGNTDDYYNVKNSLIHEVSRFGEV